jgi:uncharacterized protein (TIGR03663 family)
MEGADRVDWEEAAQRPTARQGTGRRKDLVPWAAVLLVSALLRLHDLGAAPLSPAEAREAWAGIAAAGDTGAASSGLLLGVNRCLFWLVGPGDAAARLLPALVGAVLPLAAWLLAGHLGRAGSLLAAGLLALSPSLVLFSRTASGAVLGVGAALFLLGTLLRHRESGDRRWLLAAGAALGLGIASGATFLGVLLPLALAWLIARPPELAGQERCLFERASLLTAVAVLVLSSTALFFLPAGLGATADGLGEWLSGFRVDLTAVGWPFLILLWYEPLVLVFGLFGVGRALRGQHRLLVLLAYWSLLGLGLAVLRPGQPDAVLAPLVPLALLGGALLGAVLGSALAARPARALVVATGAAITLLAAHGLISLGQYAHHIVGDVERAEASLLLTALSAILLAGAVALLWTYSRWLAVRGLTAGLAVVLAVYGWGTAWTIQQNEPRELWVEKGTAPGARLLAEALETASQRATGSAHTLPLTVQLDDPVLRWYLREFPQVSWAEDLNPGVTSEAVVTADDQQDPALGDNYLGMDLVLQVGEPAKPELPPWVAAVRWSLLRDGPPPTPERKVIVWLRQDVTLVESSRSAQDQLEFAPQ